MDSGRLSWSVEEGSMSINIFYDGKKVMNFFVGEVLDVVGRKKIMEHIKEIEQSPWISSWHKKE